MRRAPLALPASLALAAILALAPIPGRVPARAPAAPGDTPAGRLEVARSSRLRAKEAADAGDGTTAERRLLDARKAAERLLALAPADPEALREAGRVDRDAFRF